MFETTSQLERHIFRSKRNRQRKRARIHKRTVFDAARYLEIKNKCLALKKTVRVAPALMYNPLPSVERLNELLDRLAAAQERQQRDKDDANA